MAEIKTWVWIGVHVGAYVCLCAWVQMPELEAKRMNETREQLTCVENY